MAKMFNTKRLSLGGIKEKMENATQEFNAGWKNIADKAKKEAKIVNKKARKVLELEDGGGLRSKYLMTVNLDSSHTLFKRFQNEWATMHECSMANVKKADHVDNMINSFTKDYTMCSEHLNELQTNLLGLPDVLASVEIAQSRIEAIGHQVKNIEGLLLEYEDACERYELEKQRGELKDKLSQLVETKHAEYTLKKSIVHGTITSKRASSAEEGTSSTTNTKEYEKQNSLEKQKAYQDAFLDQMNEYIKFGKLEKPIAGSATEYAGDEGFTENMEIGELDLSTLREFLGPEEINSVLQASASQSKANKASVSSDDQPAYLAVVSDGTESKEPTNTAQQQHDASGSDEIAEVDDQIRTEKTVPEVAEGIEPIEVLKKSSAESCEDKGDVFTEETVPEVAKDIEPTEGQKKASAGSDEEFFDAPSEN